MGFGVFQTVTSQCYLLAYLSRYHQLLLQHTSEKMILSTLMLTLMLLRYVVSEKDMVKKQSIAQKDEKLKLNDLDMQLLVEFKNEHGDFC